MTTCQLDAECACNDAIEAVQRAIDAVEANQTIEGCARLATLAIEIRKLLAPWCAT